MKEHVIGVCLLSNRISSMKLHVAGGCAALVGVYAPRNLKPLEERQSFYDSLEEHLDKIKANVCKLVFGDLNARLGQRRTREEDILSDYCFGREAQHQVEVPNRDLLVEFCVGRQYGRKYDLPSACVQPGHLF